MDTTAYKTYKYSIKGLEISLHDITPFLRFTDGVPPEIIEIITDELERFRNVDEITGAYIIKNVSFDKANFQIRIEDQQFNVGKSIWNYLKNAEEIVIFICTAGAEISQRSKNLMDEGMMLEGYIADLIGTVVVEKAIEKIHDQLKADYLGSNKKVSNRYSPGYCAWEVKEQYKLFSFFPEKYCGIELNDSAQMLPTKSVSGFVGLGEHVRFKKYSCSNCNSVNCIYRGVKEAETIK